jgi:hypothetical protein
MRRLEVLQKKSGCEDFHRVVSGRIVSIAFLVLGL